MAETVKTNVRKRRPPSHLREGYNEDNFQPPKPYHSNRGVSFQYTQDKNQTENDLPSMLMMARLLSKFLSSANKKLNEDKNKRVENQSSEISHIPKPETSRPLRSDKQLNSQKNYAGSKIGLSSSEKTLSNNPSSQKYQEKYGRAVNQGGPNTKNKQIKGNILPAEVPKNIRMDNNFMNVDSMSKISHEQFHRLIPKGINQNMIKQQLKVANLPQSMIGTSKVLQGQPKKVSSSNQFKQDTKLFKRASFHVGIAYNIHIDNIKQRNPNFSPEELDPTYVSKKLRNSNLEMMKKQNEESQKLKRQQIIGRQKMEEEAALKILQESRFIQSKLKQEAGKDKKMSLEQKPNSQQVGIEQNKDSQILQHFQKKQAQKEGQQLEKKHNVQVNQNQLSEQPKEGEKKEEERQAQ